MIKVSAALNLSLKNLAAFGNLRFTRRQLYYEVCRTAKQPKGLELTTAAAMFAAGSLPSLALLRQKRSLAAGLFAASAVFSGSLAVLRRTPHILTPPFSIDSFDRALDSYLQHEERPFGLLGEEIGVINNLPNSYPNDLPRYGLPRLLICESREIAEMLLANNFHLEASCAIVHAAQIAPLNELFQEMLIRAVESRVYFLHDAGFAAYSLLPDLRERFALPESARLITLGLRPAHVNRLHLFVQQSNPIQPETFETLTFLTDDEKRWLAAGRRAEVAAVHPVRLLRVLRKLVLGLPTTQSIWKTLLPPRELGFMS